MQEYFKIGEISRLYGIGVDSLRYYEKIGILHPARAESGYRHYSLQDIWKLNIIRDLRALDFSMEQIREYLEDHTTETTLDLLDREEKAIEEKIRYLEGLRENVRQRAGNIRAAGSRPLDTITLEQLPERRCISIQEGYSEEHEMDVLIKRLLNLDREHLYVIGNNQIGTVISLEEARATGKIRYDSVFVVDEKGKSSLPGGTYLTVTYQGDYSKSRLWVRRLLDYADSRGLVLEGEVLELLWIDIHTSDDVQEHITELQIRTEKKV